MGTLAEVRAMAGHLVNCGMSFQNASLATVGETVFEPATFTPSAVDERILGIDILRGWAVFGMFVVHMTVSPWGIGIAPNAPALDTATYFFINAAWRGCFVALFSFLFGLGFAIQNTRARKKGIPFGPVFLRRLAGLFLIAIIAYSMIPAGDALILYACFGLTLPIAARLPRASLPFLAIGACGVATVVAALSGSGPMLFSDNANSGTVIAASLTAEPSSYTSFAIERASTLRIYFSSGHHFLARFDILGLMILGLWIGRLEIFHNLKQHNTLVVFATLILLSLGIFAALTPGLSHVPAPFFLGLGYAGVILLLLKYQAGRSLLMPLSHVGRLAFTNYLMNCAIGVFIFHPIGLGLAGKIGPFMGMLAAFLIFSVQMISSWIWLQYFRYGPVEALWRLMTYGRMPQLRIG